MAAAEQGEVGECGGAAVGPVADMVALAEAHVAAREAAAAVAMVERSAERWWNGAGAGADFHDAALGIVAHDDPARIARQPLRRSSWNARALLKDGLAGLLGVGQDLGIDVDDDLIALARSTGVEFVVQGGLGDERKGIGLLLLHGRRVGLAGVGAAALVQRLAGRRQGLDEQRADLRREPAADADGAGRGWNAGGRPRAPRP
jgi:hypothetical protein